MPLYKYLSPKAVTRFLSSWALRITPPDQFNDPFEMRPPVDLMTEAEYAEFIPDATREELPRRMAEELARQRLHIPPDHPLLGLFAMYFLGRLSPEQEKGFINSFPEQAGMAQLLPTLKAGFKQAVDQTFTLMPMFNRSIRKVLQETMREHAGVLCMSRRGMQPLMWAHYADEHRGAVIEFDEQAPCFNRRRTDEDEFGYFREVVYADTRPTVRMAEADKVFQVLALTKAVEWAYEEETRFLWPLTAADQVLDETIHLLSIPPSAITSITLGCRSSEALINEVHSLLVANSDAKHVAILRAEIDEFKFALNYVPLSLT